MAADQRLSMETNVCRLLSMDGGGIYGLATALMLKELCKRNPDFLSARDVWMFAGTSAGALNSLLLASQRIPREFVLSGELEEFWKRHDLFAGYQDVNLEMLSWAGVTPWFSRQRFTDVLTHYFGHRTLGELHHKVLITTFNWGGWNNSSWRPKLFYNFPEDEPDRQVSVVKVAYAAGAPAGMRDIPHGLGDGGIFVPNPSVNAIAKVLNHFGSSDFEQLMPLMYHFSRMIEAQSDLLYGLYTTGSDDRDEILKTYGTELKHELDAMFALSRTVSPKITNCLTELYVYADKLPSSSDDESCSFDDGSSLFSGQDIRHVMGLQLALLTEIHNVYRARSSHGEAQDGRIITMVMRAQENQKKLPEGMSQEAANQFLGMNEAIGHIVTRARLDIQIILERIRLLSLGVCGVVPSLSDSNYDKGMATYWQSPTNPSRYNYWQPSLFIGLDAPSQGANYISQQLLHNRFHRMSPQLFGPPDTDPTMVATMLAKNPAYQDALVKIIYTVMNTNGNAKRAIDRATAFLEQRWHNDHL